MRQRDSGPWAGVSDSPRPTRRPAGVLEQQRRPPDCRRARRPRRQLRQRSAVSVRRGQRRPGRRAVQGRAGSGVAGGLGARSPARLGVAGAATPPRTRDGRRRLFAATQARPPGCSQLEPRLADAFFSSHPEAVKLVLISKKSSTPPVWRALAARYRSVRFGLARAREPDLCPTTLLTSESRPAPRRAVRPAHGRLTQTRRWESSCDRSGCRL